MLLEVKNVVYQVYPVVYFFYAQAMYGAALMCDVHLLLLDAEHSLTARYLALWHCSCITHVET